MIKALKTQKSKPQRLFLIDAMAMAFRSFYALGRSPLSSATGIPTGALLGTAMFMNKLITEEKPDYLAVVSDTGKSTFREELYKDYKAHRDQMPDDLSKQIPHFFRLLSAYNCSAISVDHFEADDVIGTLAKKFASRDLQVFIVSGDKDFLQLVNDDIFLYSPKKGEAPIIYDREGVKTKFHCTPEQFIDVLALMGDSADNVPGVPGIGEVSASKLIEQFASLEGIYADLSKVKANKQRENLSQNKANAFLSRELVTLKTNIPLDVNLNDFRCVHESILTNDKLFEFYDEFGFKQLAEKMRQLKGEKISPVESKPQASLEKPIQVQSDNGVRFNLVDDSATLSDLLDKLLVSKKYGMVMVTDSDNVITGQPVGFAFACSFAGKFHSYYLPLKKDDSALNKIKPLLIDTKKLKITDNLKQALHFTQNAHLLMAPPYIDTSICDYLVDPNYGKHDVFASAERHLSYHIANQTEAWRQHCARAYASLKLYDYFEPQIKTLGLEKVLNEIELPLVKVLVEMEKEGVYIDADFLMEYSTELDKLSKDLQKKIFSEAGEEFNINSPKQLQYILYEKLKIQEQLGFTRLKRTKTGLSTDESVLKKLAKHPIAKMIVDFREVSKLKGTYVDSLPQYIHPTTGRLHTNFNQTVAATGRLSSETPNLQNIPMRSELGQEIRKAFRPKDKNWVMISADYSQVEIRLLAILAEESSLIEGFKQGRDIHQLTAAKILNLKPDEVTSEQRSQAKAINFGIIYGMGPMRLSQEIGVSMGEAKEFIKKYFEAYPGIKAYTERLIEAAQVHGFTTTITGRRRPIPTIRDSNRILRARAENIAVNAPIQGSAADLIKLAMIQIMAELHRMKAQTRLLLQIHDELLFEAPKAEEVEVKKLIKQCMEHAIETPLPFQVEIGTGRDWLASH